MRYTSILYILYSTILLYYWERSFTLWVISVRVCIFLTSVSMKKIRKLLYKGKASKGKAHGCYVLPLYMMRKRSTSW